MRKLEQAETVSPDLVKDYQDVPSFFEEIPRFFDHMYLVHLNSMARELDLAGGGLSMYWSGSTNGKRGLS